jgi:hypothetical protein
MGGGSEAKTVTAVLDEEDVVEERKHMVHKQTWEGGAGQAAPRSASREGRAGGP